MSRFNPSRKGRPDYAVPIVPIDGDGRRDSVLATVLERYSRLPSYIAYGRAMKL